jgi:hypothetical protein
MPQAHAQLPPLPPPDAAELKSSSGVPGVVVHPVPYDQWKPATAAHASPQGWRHDPYGGDHCAEVPGVKLVGLAGGTGHRPLAMARR